MSVRIYLEIGHEASIRTKKTPEGFTHDWEVYVKGCNDAEIQYYVEKVVFHLHETFPKPKRVVKEPPYTVKESGYAGFNLPIDIYLKNSQEPKKIRFNYDLQLQPSGPAIHNVQKEKYVFINSPEDFREKLLKGGGKLGGSFQEISESKGTIEDRTQMLSKPKLSGSDIKKHKTKTEDHRYTDSFQDLFGTPITTTRVPQESKSTSKENKNSSKSSDKVSAKTGNSKHISHKDSYSKEKDKDKIKDDRDKKNKDEKKSKDRNKDRERSKEKNLKRDRSPAPKSPSPKRSSPKRSPSRTSSPSVQKHKDSKHDKDKRNKSDEKKSRKDKRDKEHKENRSRDVNDDLKTTSGQKDFKNKLDNKNIKEPKHKDENPESPCQKVEENKDKIKEKPLYKEPKDDKLDKSDDKIKYKTKKKDKDKRDKKEEKSHKSIKKNEKTNSSGSRDNDKIQTKEIDKNSLFDSPKNDINKKEKNNIRVIDEDSNSSNTSDLSHSVEPPTPSLTDKIKKEEPSIELKKIKDENKNKEKSKKDRKNEKQLIKKNKRKSDSVECEEPAEKFPKEEIVNNHIEEEDIKPVVKKEDEVEYMAGLRELQHKIMGLKNNADLQKVVQLIADTGRFEISDHTFDFDLCLLDRSTVRQLQIFFENMT